MLVNLFAVVDVGQGSARFESEREGELVRAVGGGGEEGGVEAKGVVEMAMISKRADHEVVEIGGWTGNSVEEEVGGVDETVRDVSEGERGEEGGVMMVEGKGKDLGMGFLEMVEMGA